MANRRRRGTGAWRGVAGGHGGDASGGAGGDAGGLERELRAGAVSAESEAWLASAG